MMIDYLHTNPGAVIRYNTSDMVLKVRSDAGLLILPQYQIRAAAIYHLGWIDNNKLNNLVDVLCKTIKNLVTSAYKAKTSGMYLGARHGYPMRTACIKIGHPHPKHGTTFETDNRTAHGILTSNIQAKPSKSFDMRYWWIKNRIQQKMLDLIWAAVKKNAADYFT